MSSTLQASVFMGKNFSENLHSIKKTGNNLTLKQMFDISEKLIVEQSDGIFGVSQISWENFSMETNISGQWWRSHQSLACKGLCIFRFCVMSWKSEQNRTSNTAWERQLDWFKDSSQYRTLDIIDGEPMEFEWNIFQRFTTLQLVQEILKFMNKMSDPDQF